METRTKLAYFYIALMFLIALLASTKNLRTFAFFVSVVTVASLLSFAAQQIQKHGKERYWLGAIAGVALLIFIYLVLKPGPFLYPLIPWIEN